MQHSCNEETTYGGHAFERGIWYYSGIEMIDHHDISGLENPWMAFETMCGRETRPQFYINTLNRLRMLDFTPATNSDLPPNVPNSEMLINPLCSLCK